MEINNIQELINKRAEARLEKDVRELANYVYHGNAYKLLDGLKINVGDSEKPKVIGLSSVFNSDGFYRKIIEHNTERYQKEETVTFVADVERLKADVDTLLDNRDY